MNSAPENLRPAKPVDLDKAVAYMRRNVGDDRIIGKSVRAMAKRGSPSQYMKFAAELRDALES